MHRHRTLPPNSPSPRSLIPSDIRLVACEINRTVPGGASTVAMPATWAASSRVGVMTTPNPSPLFFHNLSVKGRRYARVFPEPVSAWRIAASPCINGGIACAWMPLGVVNSAEPSAFAAASDKVIPQNVVIGVTLSFSSTTFLHFVTSSSSSSRVEIMPYSRCKSYSARRAAKLGFLPFCCKPRSFNWRFNEFADCLRYSR